MRKPAWITFTGVDERTSISGMLELRKQYPIEWGVLFSPKQQGLHPRYPDLTFVRALTGTYKHELAAHICGGYARDIVANGRCAIDEPVSVHFQRAQVNGAPEDSSHAVWHWASDLGLGQVIMQCKERFPDDPYATWLFDASGGRGVAPAAWPEPPLHVLGKQWGFAGGLNPENVAAVVATIGQFGVTYWIDMESGVRDEHDRFSLEKCRAVCEAVYGAAA